MTPDLAARSRYVCLFLRMEKKTETKKRRNLCECGIWSVSNITYIRMIGYSITLPVHLINGLIMENGFYGDAMEDPNVKLYYINRTKFISCWVFVAQAIYAAIGLYCDFKTIQRVENKQSKTLKIMERTRQLFFANIIIPYTFMVTSAFWLLYLYDKNLILPSFMNKVVSSLSNHILHTGVLLVIIWEMAVLPRTTPKSHKRNLSMLTYFTAIYLSILYFSYYQLGVWAYPVLTYLHGTIYFNIFVVVVIGSLPIFYFLQWPITRFFWSETSEKKVE